MVKFFFIAIVGDFFASIAFIKGMSYEFDGFVAVVFGVIVFDYCVAWLMSLAGYAFGELVEDTARIRYLMENDNTGKSSLLAKDFSPNSVKGDNSTSNLLGNGSQNNVKIITCPSCKELQRDDSRYCGVCGVTLKK